MEMHKQIPHCWKLCICLILVVSALPGIAKDGRDFAGFYELTNINDLGDTFQVSFSVRIFNYSDADVSGATVTLEDCLMRDQSYGAFYAVSIPMGQSVRLRDLVITIPRREYEHWQHDAPPCLRIEFVKASGDDVRRLVELSHKLRGQRV